MSALTSVLHAAFLGPFGTRARVIGSTADKPLLVDLELPLPPHLRVYMYSLVGSGGRTRQGEYKAVLRLRGHQVGTYRSFDNSDGRLALAIGYRADLDVFVLWDSSLHPRFKNGGNIQVSVDTVMRAASTGYAEQRRRLVNLRTVEIVLACRSGRLVDTVERRVALTGGADEVRGGEDGRAAG